MSMQSSVSRRAALVALGSALAAPAAIAQVRDLADAVNKAGRQRMLSQRMVKAWLALGQQVEPARAERALNESMTLFDRQLAELREFAPTDAIRETYEQLEPLWGKLKRALVGTAPSAAAAPALLALDAKVLAMAHQGTQQLEQHSGKPVGHLVNVAGRERMLSQRMAKFQLSLAWQGGEAAREQIAIARREFVAALDVLGNAAEATDAIREQLALARQQWIFFDSALNRAAGPVGREAADVFVSSENILQVMDHITGLYARLGA
jgi:nitrate/nitrite-specific signal transduction histidine kinase